MRVPVRLPIQHVHAGAGVRRASVHGAHRVHGPDPYGGDVRLRDPLSLVFRGNLGQEVPAVDQIYDLSTPVYESPVLDTSAIYGYDTSAAYQSGSAVVGVPGATPQIDSAGNVVGWYKVNANGTTTLYTAQGVLAGATSPSVPPPGDSSWWQDLSRFVLGTVGPASVLAQVIRGPGTPSAGVTSYIIPATATSPAQRVSYNPATGQITTTPTAAGGVVYNPATGQYTAAGAAWYQNPVMLFGGGLLVVLLLVMAARR